MATQLTFYHPDIPGPKTLEISIRPNEITWGYHMNTQVYPTYAGEVVQILSVYVDDLVIQGNLRTYKEMETIYNWFLNYIQIATQGKRSLSPNDASSTSYNEIPVTMTYAHRGWSLKIKPLELPGFKYGTDVVSPEWQMRAAIVEDDPEIIAETVNLVLAKKLGDIGKVKLFAEHSPFTDPTADPAYASSTNKRTTALDAAITNSSDFYNTFMTNATSSNPISAFGLSASQAASPTSSNSTTTTK